MAAILDFYYDFSDFQNIGDFTENSKKCNILQSNGFDLGQHGIKNVCFWKTNHFQLIATILAAILALYDDFSVQKIVDYTEKSKNGNIFAK